ncbi:tRNA nucleotidyltransferase (CCA-adding enzyme) [Paenibacillus sp. UNC496MF]|uniref:CCA tRNA nucleotidyltransferase n=1 Tax=Paenibacillus sp. UNC496MF TaxID=1502753 RepID=UPI0008F232A8|nr:CCA tRNA nucleotidyltransferase [Paenibacillus sp. UNC496MF]SFI55101.1 tRNA nucleotidyltransferase (CCA-adding enzyme) [Paenibacillus sp. UNC496MF]
MSMSEALTKALPLLAALEARGFEAVFVGGCVRDTLLGRPLKDVDIATAASPEEVIAAFPRTIPTGLQHGTVTVVHEGGTYEITTFRTESAYERFRRPSEVRFVTELKEDLLRRDFTINAMAMRADGTMVDPFGGRRDLERGILRCVGEADARLQEDALRIVRAVRFAAAYDLRIAPGTWRAVRRHRGLLAHIAMERIGLEFDKMIGGSRPERAGALLAASGLLGCTKEPLPEAFASAAAAYAALSARRRSEAAPLTRGFRGLAGIPDGQDRWAALCALLGLGADASLKLFGTLRYAAVRGERLAAVLAVHGAMAERAERDLLGLAGSPAAENDAAAARLSDDTRRSWILAALRHGQAAALAWTGIVKRVPDLIAADGQTAERYAGLGPYAQALEATVRGMPAGAIRDLAVKGKELLALADRPPGPWLGQLLQGLLETAALGGVPNEKAALLAEAADRLAQIDKPQETRGDHS